VIALWGGRLESLDRILCVCFICYFITVDEALVNSTLLHQDQEVTVIVLVRYTGFSFSYKHVLH
jgi:hypothetical protein